MAASPQPPSNPTPPTGDDDGLPPTFLSGLYGERPGDEIGPYRLLGVIGEGGFGVVWLAERRHPHRQRVAIKVVKPGMDSSAVFARFEQERQTLAVMDHPNVARIFDGGVTPAGRPYFVMEHVRGEPITAYCDRHTLTNRDRLALFIPVCEAVQHAHQKGVIHRDLKPSNILVTVVDGHPIPKVIDFGVAKAVSRTFTEKTIFTETGQFIGTPEYMSPEQAEMGGTDIDTRTDVYALGVVLYQLLTGLLPFDAEDLRSKAFDEIRRIIREVEPPTPSKRLTTIADASAAEIAKKRQSARDSLASELRRELEWVPLKAMRKDRTHRYSSAENLAADIRRFLDGRPLEAGPESLRYRARKYLRRHRGPVAAVGAVCVALGLGLGTAAWQWREAVHQASVAEKRALAEEKARRRAEAVIDFVTTALQTDDPTVGGKEGTTISHAMGTALASLQQGSFRNDPDTEAALEDVIGCVLQNTSRSAEAEPILAHALETRRRLYPGGHTDVVVSLANLASAKIDLGNSDQASALLEEGLGTNRRLHPGDHSDTARCLETLAVVRLAQGKPTECEPLIAQAVDMRRRLSVGDSQELARSLDYMARIREALGRPRDAEPLFREALDIRSRLFPGDHADVASSLNNYAASLQSLGRDAEAEPYYVRSLEMSRRIYRGDHVQVATILNNLGDVWSRLGRADDAEAAYRESLEMRRRMHPGDHPTIATSFNNYATFVLSRGRPADAEKQYLEALAMQRRLYRGDHPETAETLDNLTRCRMSLLPAAECEPDARAALTMYQRLYPEGHPRLANAMAPLAMILAKERKFAEAKKMIAEAETMALKFEPPEGPNARRVIAVRKQIEEASKP